MIGAVKPDGSPTTFTFWTTLLPVGRSGCNPSIPLSSTATVTPVPVKPSVFHTSVAPITVVLSSRKYWSGRL